MKIPRAIFVTALLLMIATRSRSVAADTPLVEFDVGYTIACKDTTPPEFADRNPNRKIIEAVIAISPKLVAGNESDLLELYLEIYSPDDQMPVISFAPSTDVASDVADGILRVESTESAGQIGVRYRATPHSGEVRAAGTSSESRVTYELLAPKRLLIASGSIRRSHGVYFKMKPTKQGTLQGKREFACLFEVPKRWRGDHVTIRCEAKRLSGAFSRKEVNCGLAQFAVGLHLDGDEEANKKAKLLAKTQQAVLDEIVKREKEVIQQISLLDSVFDWIFAFFSSPRQGIVLESRTATVAFALNAMIIDEKIDEEKLPKDIKTAREGLDYAKNNLRALNGR